jgi:hypothetical protein
MCVFSLDTGDDVLMSGGILAGCHGNAIKDVAIARLRSDWQNP